MEVKPIPKPRSMVPERPVPAPRRPPPTLPVAPRLSSQSESSQSEKSDDTRSIPETRSSSNNEFFRTLSTSSRQLKDEISEKVTTKGRAVISSTRNASIRLEKSVKNLLTRRLTTLNQDELLRSGSTGSKMTDPIEDERCVSMPADDIFSRISFCSPLNNNLRSVRNEEDLSGMRQSPPPPVYPPPPLPDESIYDELQSVTSGSNRYDTISSIVSDKDSVFSDKVERDFPEASDLLNFALNQASDSDQSLNLSDININAALSQDKTNSRRLSRSASWTFYDTAPPNKPDEVDELDRISSTEEDILYLDEPLLNRTSSTSNESQASIQNSLYENLSPQKAPPQETQESSTSTDNRQQSSRSLLVEFDPFAKTSDEYVYSNYENNDMMLLEAFLAINDSPGSSGSVLDFQEAVDNEEEQEDVDEEDILQPQISTVPPEPPKRYDSLPKNEYDEVAEATSQPDKAAIKKNPALLPKLAHLVTRKQPAVPPRKSSTKLNSNTLSTAPGAVTATTDETISSTATTTVTTAPSNPQGSPTNTASGKVVEEHPLVGVIQKLKKLRYESSGHGIKPNMITFVKSGNKLLLKNPSHYGSTAASESTKLERPEVNVPHPTVTHRGIVYITSDKFERTCSPGHLVQRGAVLADQKLTFYTNRNMSTVKTVIQLNKVYSIHLMQYEEIVDGETVHGITLSVEGRAFVLSFFVKGIVERRCWVQKLAQAIFPVFPTKYTMDMTRASWAYLKEGVTGAWFPAWLLLRQQTLIYKKALEHSPAFGELDVRKARCMVIRRLEGPKSSVIPMLVVDTGGGGALHVAGPKGGGVAAWRMALYVAATVGGPALEQQQLTQENVPVILDKCINFIYVYGIMTEGIYRRSGSNSAAAKLLDILRKDAWGTQITKDKYTEHDVATVLRRFLRDLPDPLFPTSIHDRLCLNTENVNENEKVTTYRKLLSTLNPIPAATVRKILAHLHCLSQQSSRNLMTVKNLSAIWGPTLMHGGENSAEDWNRAETRVVGDLIKLYPKLYQLTAADLEKEAKILEVLEKYHISNNGPRGTPSGDLKMWIYIFSKEEECVNVTIGPRKTAYDVCKELAEKTNLPAHELYLEECTLSGALERPLHYTERVLETVARWGYWDPEDRKDNVLILKRDQLYKDIIPLMKPPLSPFGELKFADRKTKSFKNYLFELSQAKLCCYKDKVCSNKIHEWKVEDLIWYLGHEPKRNPQTGWSITFIEKNKKPTRCKESPFFGNTLAGTVKNDQYKWLAAMIFEKYQLNLQPPSINLMDL
ncbi:rhoGAP_ARAP and RA_ARAPs domain-containing protein RhoGAP15B [Calliopsis andreniformis]|uniref:rhoGAP_ARAP and RA_ARAPs domain-containing protein RhoGAP15B n=1 Tax=Calliopsis andreniformis TaxID=337506 RepID=UPI003FCCD394